MATFTVTRSGGTAAFDVNFATSDGTATVADSDYVAASNTLHFGANENTQTISVTINGDTKVEANETFNVILSNATNGATISDSQGVGTITNDDGAADRGLGLDQRRARSARATAARRWRPSRSPAAAARQRST